MSPLLEESPAPVALGSLNEGEGRVLRTRRRLGLTLAPLLFAVLLATPMPALRPEAHRLAGVTAAVVVLWITEALPMVRRGRTSEFRKASGERLDGTAGVSPAFPKSRRDACGPGSVKDGVAGVPLHSQDQKQAGRLRSPDRRRPACLFF